MKDVPWLFFFLWSVALWSMGLALVLKLIKRSEKHIKTFLRREIRLASTPVRHWVLRPEKPRREGDWISVEEARTEREAYAAYCKRGKPEFAKHEIVFEPGAAIDEKL